MADDTPGAEEKKKSKKGIILPVVALVIGLGGGGGAFFLTQGGKAEASAEATTTTALGRIVRLDPITMNLSDGRVLKVGLALQMVKEPKNEELAALLATAGAKTAEGQPLGGEEAKAPDQAILELGNKTYAELSAPGGRGKAKGELTKKITEHFEGDVVAVYYTDFVMS